MSDTVAPLERLRQEEAEEAALRAREARLESEVRSAEAGSFQQQVGASYGYI